jgi:hypothetical protein
MTLQPLLGSGCFFSFVILYIVSGTPWTGDQPVTRPLTCILRVGFEPTTPVSEQGKIVHALDRYRHSTFTLTLFSIHCMKKKTKLRGLSLQANYTDRATAACWRG